MASVYVTETDDAPSARRREGSLGSAKMVTSAGTRLRPAGSSMPLAAVTAAVRLVWMACVACATVTLAAEMPTAKVPRSVLSAGVVVVATVVVVWVVVVVVVRGCQHASPASLSATLCEVSESCAARLAITMRGNSAENVRLRLAALVVTEIETCNRRRKREKSREGEEHT